MILTSGHNFVDYLYHEKYKGIIKTVLIKEWKIEDEDSDIEYSIPDSQTRLIFGENGLIEKRIYEKQQGQKIFNKDKEEYSIEEYIKNPQDWTLQTYNKKNQLIKAEDYYNKRKTGTIRDWKYEYDEEGRLTTRILNHGTTERYNYEQNGRISEKLSWRRHPISEELILADRTEFTYDSSGNLDKFVTYNLPSDEDGNECYDKLLEYCGVNKFEYSNLENSGLQIRMSNYNEHSELEIIYKSNFDRFGNLVSKKILDEKRKKINEMKLEYTYDQFNNWIKLVRYGISPRIIKREIKYKNQAADIE